MSSWWRAYASKLVGEGTFPEGLKGSWARRCATLLDMTEGSGSWSRRQSPIIAPGPWTREIALQYEPDDEPQISPWMRMAASRYGKPHPPIEPHHLNLLVPEPDGFNDFSHEFELATTDIIVGISACYEGNPVFTIEHGGEPLTIVAQQRYQSFVTLIAVGRGLTIETAPLTVNVTGGSVGTGAIRVGEMRNVAAGLVGWRAEKSAYASTGATATMDTASGGSVKAAVATEQFFGGNTFNIGDAEMAFTGTVASGAPISMEGYTWNMQARWTRNGNTFTHTGSRSSIALPMDRHASFGYRVRISIAEGATATLNGYYSPTSLANGITWSGPFEGDLYSSFTNVNGVIIEAMGDVVITEVETFETEKQLRFAFTDAGTGEVGKVIRATTNAVSSTAFVAAEILGEDVE